MPMLRGWIVVNSHLVCYFGHHDCPSVVNARCFSHRSILFSFQKSRGWDPGAVFSFFWVVFSEGPLLGAHDISFRCAKYGHLLRPPGGIWPTSFLVLELPVRMCQQ